MPTDIRIFLNERGLTIPAGSRVREAIAAALPELLPACEAGEAFVTDGRGLPLALEVPLEAGTILRAARRSHRGVAAPDADAGC